MEWLTVAQATKQFGLTDAPIRYLVKVRKVRAKRGHPLRISAPDLKAYCDWRENLPAAPKGRIAEDDVQRLFKTIALSVLQGFWRRSNRNYGRNEGTRARKRHCPLLGKPLTVEHYPVRRGDRIVMHPHYLLDELRKIEKRASREMGRCRKDGVEYWSASRIAAELGISASTLGNWRAGRTPFPAGQLNAIQTRILAPTRDGRIMFLRQWVYPLAQIHAARYRPVGSALPPANGHQAPPTTSPRLQSGYSELKLPHKSDQLDLWKLLHDNQQSGKSDREIARQFSDKNGLRILTALKVSRKRGRISDWRAAQ